MDKEAVVRQLWHILGLVEDVLEGLGEALDDPDEEDSEGEDGVYFPSVPRPGNQSKAGPSSSRSSTTQ